MPIIVSCPDCGGKLRVNVEADQEKRVKCPKCAGVFVARAPEQDDADDARITPAPPAKRSRAEIAEREEEEERTDARRERKRRPDADEDEDEDRPARRKRRPESRREDEEDDEDDRPVRRKKKRKKKGISAGLLIGLIGGGVAVLAGIGVLLIFLLGGGGSPYSRHEAAAREVIALMNELAAALESVKDQNSARAAASRINSVCDRMEALSRRVKALPKLTAEEDRKLQNSLKGDMDAIAQRVVVATPQAAANARGEQTLVAAAKRLQSLGNLFR
jgi:hypothetical protein